MHTPTSPGKQVLQRCGHQGHAAHQFATSLALSCH